MDLKTKSGYVSIVGKTNAGKSTLLNNILGQKIAITSRKPQTTRHRFLGIRTNNEYQIIFVDTPGIFKPKRRLDRAMVHAAWKGTDEADVTLLLHDSARTSIDEETTAIIKQITKIKCEFPNRKFVLVLNKIDLIKPENLLERASHLTKMLEFWQNSTAEFQRSQPPIL